MKTKRKNNIVNPRGEDIATFSRFANFEAEEDFLQEEDDDDTEVDPEAAYNHDLFTRTIKNIRHGVNSRVITPDNAVALEIQAINDYRDRLTQSLGYDPEEVDEFLAELADEDDDEDEDEGDYSSGVDIATFSAGNNFAAGLQVLLRDRGYTDLEEGVTDLAHSLGQDPEDTAGLFTGDFVPSPELVAQIASVFELDDDDYSQLDQLGEEARASGYEDDDDEEEDEGAEYASHIENRLAEFEYKAQVKDAIASIELNARKGVENGWFPPFAYRELFGNFELEGDQIAAFSASCEASQVDANTQLYGMNYAVELFRRCGPIINFSSIQEPLSEREVAIETNIKDQAKRNRALRIQRK